MGLVLAAPFAHQLNISSTLFSCPSLTLEFGGIAAHKVEFSLPARHVGMLGVCIGDSRLAQDRPLSNNSVTLVIKKRRRKNENVLKPNLKLKK